MNVKTVKSSWLMCLVALSITATVQAADYTWTGASGGGWNAAANWGGVDFPRFAGDTATISTNLTAAYVVNLNTSVSINSLSVTDTDTATKYSLNINNGTGTPILTFNGLTPSISSMVDGGQTLQINTAVDFNTPNAVLTKSGTSTAYFSNPGVNFFSNLNLLGGLNISASTLRIGNITGAVPPLSGLKVGTGSLQLDLSNTSTFFMNQPSIGGTGDRYITNVRNVSDGASNPQTLINNSTGRLEIRLEPSTTTTFFNSLAGVSSIAPYNGTFLLNNFTGTVSLVSKTLDTSAAGSKLILSGNGAAVAATTLNGGSFSTGAGDLALGEGVTLNVDGNTGIFNVMTLIITSGHSSNPSAGGDATVNWNASGKTIRGTLDFAVQGGGNARFNMLGGSLTPGGNIALGSTSHDYDGSAPLLEVSGGKLTLASTKNFSMSSVPTGGAEVRSTLTIKSSGLLDLTSAGNINVGQRSGVHATQATVSDATINLDGGTLKLGKTISRQTPVLTATANSSAKVQFYFNGGTLLVGANIAQLFTNFGVTNSNSDGVFVKTGGAVIDCGNYTAAIANDLLEAPGSMGGGLIKNGAGTLTLSGTNTYSGGTAVNDGVLIVNNLAGSGVGTGAVTVNGGAIGFPSTDRLGAGNTVTIGPNGALIAPNKAALITLTNDVRFILNPASAVGLYDTWDLTAVDPSRVFYYSGSVTITANNTATLPNGVAFGLGLINIGNLTTLDGALGDTAFGPSTAPLYLSGTTIKNNDNNPIISALRTITLNAGGAAFTAGWSKTLTVLSKLTGVGGFNANCDSGYVILSNTANDYSGDTTIATLWNGFYGATARLKLGASEVLPHGAGKGNLILNTGATLEMNGFSETVNGLSSIAANAIITNASVNPVVLTVGANNATSSYAGKIIGAIGFVKTGTGTVTLAAPCAYPGTTTVSAGTLALDSACTLASTNVVVCRDASLSLVTAGVFGGTGSKTELFVGEAGVTLGAQGKVIIPTGVEVSVFHFGINGLYKKAGTWGASGSGAEFVDDAIFAGEGILRVLETGPQRGTVIRFM